MRLDPRPVKEEPRSRLAVSRRPLQNALAGVGFVIGVTAFVLGFIVSAHVIASALGAIGFFAGLFAQYISSTTAQRTFIVAGTVAAFVGAALGIAHGGFDPNV